MSFFGIAALLLWNVQNDELLKFIQQHRLLGATLFSMIMLGTTVIAPLTSLPLVPVVAPFLGPFTTGFACFIGWFLGALVAFIIGRTYGRPFILRFVPLESITKYESYIKPEMEFMVIVTLRMLVPVDILSYLLGVLSHVSFRVYAGATALGIVWFSFAFAYLGSALNSRNYVLLVSIGVASVVILYTAWRYIKKL